eukprot:jgi/Psemu1/62546/estExt_Genemark1.C_40049
MERIVVHQHFWDSSHTRPPTSSIISPKLVVATTRKIKTMDKFAPATVGADELPDGFTQANPHGGASGGNSEAEFKQLAIQEQKQMILEQAMDSQALARLGRIRLVKPQKAADIEKTIVSMAMQGKLPGKINEGKLVEILERKSRAEAQAAESASHNIQIQRKRYSMDSDDEDDDDDDI